MLAISEPKIITDDYSATNVGALVSSVTAFSAAFFFFLAALGLAEVLSSFCTEKRIK